MPFSKKYCGRFKSQHRTENRIMTLKIAGHKGLRNIVASSAKNINKRPLLIFSNHSPPTSQETKKTILKGIQCAVRKYFSLENSLQYSLAIFYNVSLLNLFRIPKTLCSKNVQYLYIFAKRNLYVIRLKCFNFILITLFATTY